MFIKSKVEFNKQEKFLTDYNLYNRVIDEVIEANQNLDAKSQKFKETISLFSVLNVENIDAKSNIKLNKNIIGLISIEVFVNNRKMIFIIDTGAQVSCLTHKKLLTLNDIKKTNKKVEVGCANNQISEMEVALVNKIQIGNTEFFNLPVIILEEKKLSLSLFGYKLFKFDGILGWDVLKHLDFEIDYKNSEFRIEQFDEEDTICNLIKSDFPTVLVIDEKDEIRTFGIDTGARRSWINYKLAEQAKLKIFKKKRRKVYGFYGKQIKNVKIIKEYKISLKDSLIIFEKIETGFTGLLNNYDFDGVLGSDIMKDNILRVINSKGIVKIMKNNII